jgi:hypothetical protein
MASSTDTARIRELRYMDGLSCPQVAILMGCHEETVRRIAPGYPGKIDNTRLREAFLASGCTAHEVALQLGWYAGKKPDGTTVKRTLGLVETIGGHRRYRQYRCLIDAETAALIADAIGVAPWSVGCHDA